MSRSSQNSAFFLCLISSLLCLLACNDDPPEDLAGDDGGTDLGSDTDPVDHLTGATPNASNAVLVNTHLGWKTANCASAGCHPGNHQDSFRGSECAHCHGVNGAPELPMGHENQNCGSTDCHGDAHQGLGFTASNDCRSCHQYAETADGCSYSEEYDVVIIGAGGAGLAAAAQLAKDGKNIVVLEQHFKVGGCMVNFHRGDYRFEASLHAFDGFSLTHLDTLSIADQVKPVRATPVMYQLISPEFTLDIPADVEAYRGLLKKQFPAESANIDSLFDSFASLPMAAQYPGLSLLEAVKSHGITDEKLISVFTVLAGFLAENPDNLPADSFKPMWFSYHVIGYNFFEGGSQSISDALESSILTNGGKIKLNTRVSKIEVNGGKVTGVRTTDGGCYHSEIVISNANAPSTFLELVGDEHLPADLLQEVRAREPASSRISMMFLGVDHDYSPLFPGNTHEILVSTSYPFTSQHFDDLLCNPEEALLTITNYTVPDPETAPAGKNAIVVTVDGLDYECNNQWQFKDAYGSYQQYKQALAEVLLPRVEQYLPGIIDHIEVIEIASPHTVEQYTLNPGGSWAGWKYELDGKFNYTDSHETPIQGLYLTGAWVGGAGQSVALGSGIQVAEIVTP